MQDMNDLISQMIEHKKNSTLLSTMGYIWAQIQQLITKRNL